MYADPEITGCCPHCGCRARSAAIDVLRDEGVVIECGVCGHEFVFDPWGKGPRAESFHRRALLVFDYEGYRECLAWMEAFRSEQVRVGTLEVSFA